MMSREVLYHSNQSGAGIIIGEPIKVSSTLIMGLPLLAPAIGRDKVSFAYLLPENFFLLSRLTATQDRYIVYTSW